MDKLQTMMKKSFLICSLAILAVVSFQASASDVRSKQIEIEQIEVTGEKTRLYYLHQMRKAELDFYDAYNALNDVEDFRIICRRERPTGTNIKYKVCYPQYLLQRWANETQDAIAGRSINGLAASAVVLPSLADVEFLTQREKEKSLEHTESLVKKHPALLEKLVSLEEKRLAYAKARETL